jgi:hypothetical protein
MKITNDFDAKMKLNLGHLKILLGKNWRHNWFDASEVPDKYSIPLSR